MDHALPASDSHDLRPWLWALAITLLASALMLLRIHWAYETDAGLNALESNKRNQFLIMSTHRLLLFAPVVAHLAMAARWRPARLVNLALAGLGVLTWHEVWYPAGLGVLALMDLFPEWREVWSNYALGRPTFLNPH